ncbi:MAG: TonB-dependent receptor [Pseudomonadota bacterium]
MSTGKRLAGLLLLTTSLTFPTVLHAQTTGDPDEDAGDPLAEEVDSVDQEEEFEDPEISVPGGGIIVTGRRNRNPERNSTQVLDVLTEADIARTGESDIAGALSRVTGLSVVGNGRVFVRGLGDRYSLALLNGLPLPSPEPLSRVVPLDIFPTNVVASSLVQKTYSANYPGEFGGGVINLTTRAIPVDDFLKISVGASGDTETTFENGLTYFGSDWDTFGFDNGNRDIPLGLQPFFTGDTPFSAIGTQEEEFVAQQLLPVNLVTLQQDNSLRPNFSGSLTAGKSFELGDDTFLGIVATAGIRNNLRNRSVTFQEGNSDLSALNFASDTFITDENVLVNGLLNFGLDIGPHTIRWTNLYIRDTLKTARLENAQDLTITPAPDFSTQRTAWFERQLIDTQLVGEFEFDRLEVDIRGGYARTDREAPYNALVRYQRQNDPDLPFGGTDFIADTPGLLPGGRAVLVQFDDLQEENYFAGIDLSYEVLDTLDLTVGYAYNDTDRTSTSFVFSPQVSGEIVDLGNGETLDTSPFITATGFRQPGGLFAADVLALGDVDVDQLNAFPAFGAALEIQAAYGLFRWVPTDRITVEGGVRYEDAEQVVSLLETNFAPAFTGGNAPATNLNNDYFLPSGTITWEPIDDLQLRIAASQTIARPQFRELIEQPYFDPETNRQFRGNTELVDSELLNIEARAEYYMGGQNRISIAGFYKDIENPIEPLNTVTPGELIVSFANAPSAELYGAEIDLVYGIDLFSLGGSFFETKQLLIIANYTYTQSSLSVGPDDISPERVNLNRPSSSVFDDGASLIGQSDHIANLSIGIEDTEKTQQATVLFNYASERPTLRGLGDQPDAVEDPGLTVDFVARTEVNVLGPPLELSFEVRNIFGRDNFEFQEFNGNRIELNTFDVGTSFSLGLSVEF